MLHRFMLENPKRDRKRRLGWHKKTDPRSLEHHGVKGHLESVGKGHLLGEPLVSKIWTRTLKPLNQGDLGSCTGNAIAGLLATAPNSHDGVKDDIKVTEALAKKIYSLATELDDIHGKWPGEDTGSTGLDALRAAKQLGLIAAYKSCKNAAEALQILAHVGPIAVGTNWLSGMDEPKGKRSMLSAKGKNEGGHEYAVIGIDIETDTVLMINSWGSAWGEKGRARISFDDFEKLIDDMDGDAVLILPPARP